MANMDSPNPTVKTVRKHLEESLDSYLQNSKPSKRELSAWLVGVEAACDVVLKHVKDERGTIGWIIAEELADYLYAKTGIEVN